MTSPDAPTVSVFISRTGTSFILLYSVGFCSLATYSQRATANRMDIMRVLTFLFVIHDILNPPFQETTILVLLGLVQVCQHLFKRLCIQVP